MDSELRQFREEFRGLKRELRGLEKGTEFLDDSEKRIMHILDSLSEFSGCNMYANYSTLKMEVKDAIYKFYNTLTAQRLDSEKRTREKLYSLTVGSVSGR